MSGSVVVEGNASQSAGATGRGGLLVIRGDAVLALRHLDEGRRHRRARVGRAHERLHGPEGPPAGVRRRRRRAGRLDLRGAALRARRGRRPRRRLHREGAARRARAPRFGRCSSGRASTTSIPPSSAATDRRASSTTSRSTTPGTSEMALRESALFSREVIAEIQRAAREGVYDIRGFGAKRRLPHFDDLLLLGASVSRYPLEGYRERCDTNVVLGTRHAKRPLELDIPITIAGMSFGALSAPAKEALGRGASAMGTSTTTGDGGMTPEERAASKTLVYQLLPSRYGMNPDDLRRADAIEIVIGQGAKPGGGGHPARPEDLRSRRGDARPAAGHRPAQRVPSPRLDRARRPRRSRSRSCARSPTGRSRSSSRSARRAPTSTSRSRSRRAPTSSSSTACRAGPRRRRTSSSSTSGSRRCRPCASRWTRCRSSGCTAASSSSSPAGSARAPTSPRRSRSGPTRSRSGWRRSSPWATTRPPSPRSTSASAPRPASTTTGRRAATRSGSLRRTTSSPRASIPSSAAAGWPTTCAPWSSRPRPWPARAASRTSRTSSPRTSSRSPSRRRRWPGCRSRARTGSRGRPGTMTARLRARAGRADARAIIGRCPRSPTARWEQLLEQVAAESPSPGGGSSCALACALAAGLVEMAAAFTLARAEYAERHERMARGARARRRAARRGARAGRARAPRLRRGARRAAAARGRARARRAPRGGDVRRGRQPAGGRPRRRRGRRAGRRGRRSTGNRHLRGDAISACVLAEAACTAAARLVEINLTGRPEDPRREEAAELPRRALAARLTALSPERDV